MARMSLEKLWVLLKTEQDGEHLSIQSLGFKHNSADIHILVCIQVVCNETVQTRKFDSVHGFYFLDWEQEGNEDSSCLLRFLKH